MIDFPNNPTTGQQYTAAGVTWTWDGAKWLPSGLAPTVAPGINDNRIINGDMRVNQRGTASGTVAGYTVDRWQFNAAQTGKGSWNQSTATAGGALLAAAGVGYFLSFTSSSAYTLLASDDFNFSQPIEADLMVDFAWGTSGAQPVTLSFWASTTIAGTFGGCIRNLPAPSTRSYPFTYSLPTTNVWTKIVITIPGDTGGPWVLQGNASGAYLTFSLGMGSTYSGPANAWAAANYHAPTGAISVVSTNGAAFSITGVKLEIGSVATAFNRQSLAKSLADCQRYYQKIGGAISQDVQVQGYVSTAGMGVTNTIGIYPMRAAPTAAIVGAFSQTNVASVNLFGGSQTLVAQIIATAAGTMQWSSVGTTAYVTLSAEL